MPPILARRKKRETMAAMRSIGWGLLVLCATITLGLAACDATTTTGGGFGGSAGSPGTSAGAAASNGGAGHAGGTNTAGTGGQIVASDCATAPNACGGDLTGSWKISQVCTEGDLTQYSNNQIAQTSTACSNTFQSVTMSASGALSYNSGTLTTDASITLSEDLLLTPACFSGIAGQPVTVNAALCSSYVSTLEAQSAGSTASCAFDGTNCNCALSITKPGNSDTYSISGTSIVWSDGSTSTYCVQGNTMVERDEVVPNVYIVTTMTKQ
jgi:hypothetical protein